MGKFFKWLGIVIGSLVLLLLIAFVALVTFVSPNRFKPTIIAQVKNATGRDLIMDGDLSWTLFPTLGIKAGHIQLNNPQGFSEKIFAEMSSMTMSVKILPLLHKKIESKGITLTGLHVNLIKNANGVTNWAFPVVPVPVTVTTTTTPTNSSTQIQQVTYGVAISSINVDDATINWADEQAKKFALINHANFHAKDINLEKPFPIESNFDFTAKNPDMSGHFDFTTDASFNLSKQMFFMKNVDIKTNLNQANKNYSITVQGDVTGDLNQETLQWSNFKGTLANLNLTGNLNVTHLKTTPEVTGQFNIQPFDLKMLLQQLGQDTTNIQSAKDVKGNISFIASQQTVSANGNFTVDELVAAKLRMTNVSSVLRFQNGTVDLLPIKATLYQGTLDAQAQAKINTSEPQLLLQAQLRNVQAEPLLRDVRGQQKFTLQGAGNIDVQMTTSGANSNAMTQNLNGTTRINFANGIIKGVDIGYIIDSGSAYLQRQSPTGTNTDQTSFGNLTATAIIHNGVISNNDLLIDSPRFTTKGKGTIDLVNQQINYNLQSIVKENGPAKNLAGATIPVSIKGSLDNPSIRLDTAGLFQSLANQQLNKHKENIQNKVIDQIQNKLGGQLPGNAENILKSMLHH